MNIAIIAHDNKKAELAFFVKTFFHFFTRQDCNLFATGNTGRSVEKMGISNITILQSGPMGGDAQIAALLVEGKIDIVFFFIDPLDSHPHEVDVHMLLRLCNVHNITLATNKATATHIIHSILASNISTSPKIPQS